MYQANQRIWNEIAAASPLREQISYELMEADGEDERDKLLDKLAERAVQKGADQSTVLAYLETRVLLMENVAISRYIQKSSQPYLRTCLPELTNLNEALIWATHAFSLDLEQMRMLRSLLLADETSLKT